LLSQKKQIQPNPGGEADFQTRRAVKLASDNDEVKKLRAEVVQLLKLPE